MFAKVFVSDKEEKEVREIWEFMSGSLIYWRIVCKNGYVIEGCQEKISIVTSCLTEEKAIDVFTYLKNVATMVKLKQRMRFGIEIARSSTTGIHKIYTFVYLRQDSIFLLFLCFNLTMVI